VLPTSTSFFAQELRFTFELAPLFPSGLLKHTSLNLRDRQGRNEQTLIRLARHPRHQCVSDGVGPHQKGAAMLWFCSNMGPFGLRLLQAGFVIKISHFPK
jgi:hypothetical protein